MFDSIHSSVSDQSDIRSDANVPLTVPADAYDMLDEVYRHELPLTDEELDWLDNHVNRPMGPAEQVAIGRVASMNAIISLFDAPPAA